MTESYPLVAERYDEDWQAYACVDCNPEYAASEEEAPYDKPYMILIPEGEPYPDTCPRCGDYLSLVDGDKGLRIANTPAQRWAAQRSAAQVQPPYWKPEL